jgi:hypothetical protein
MTRKDSSLSTRSFSRARTSDERGFVLVAALTIAVLYLSLIELLLIDATRAYQEAQRFRSRILAATLAEDAAELAADQMVVKPGGTVNVTDARGTIEGTYSRSGENFELKGRAITAGVAPETATVRLQGRIVDGRVVIDYAQHSQ